MRGEAMNNYMRALHQRFFQEPEYTELEERIESTRQEVRDCLDQLHRRKLMELIDTQYCARRSPWQALRMGFNWPGESQKNWRQMACIPSTRSRQIGFATK